MPNTKDKQRISPRQDAYTDIHVKRRCQIDINEMDVSLPLLHGVIKVAKFEE